jgi:hypothetical protein
MAVIPEKSSAVPDTAEALEAFIIATIARLAIGE